LGQPNNRDQQIEVLKESLDLLRNQNGPGVISESKIKYGGDRKNSLR
jgi:hypothetical protein